MLAGLWYIHNISKDQEYFSILIQISMKENSYKLVSANAYLINYISLRILINIILHF